MSLSPFSESFLLLSSRRYHASSRMILWRLWWMNTIQATQEILLLINNSFSPARVCSYMISHWFTLVFSAEKHLYQVFISIHFHNHILGLHCVFYSISSTLNNALPSSSLCEKIAFPQYFRTLKKQITVINMILLYGCEIQEQVSKSHVELAKTF